jgi:hypothetical protein
MRTLDRTPPALAPHPLPPASPMADWPATLHIAIERVPQSAYVWDDDDPTILWDDPNPDRLVYDAPLIGGGFTDAVCDFQAVEIDRGEPDDLGLFGAAIATVSLANPTGEYSLWTVDGRLAYWAPGRLLQIFADVDGAPWWLFCGRVTEWAENADGTVTIEAADGFNLLAQETPPYTVGAAGQTPAARLTAIAAFAAYTDPVRFDIGDAPLVTALSDRTPLDEMQTVALSDGGVLFCDADGALLYRDRRWMVGRTDQVTVDTFSDNVCTAPLIVWDAVLTSRDKGLVNHVKLSNTAGLVAETTLGATPRLTLTHPEPDLWQTQAAGDALAAWLLAARSSPVMAIERFELHLTDPRQDLWRAAIDRRIGDRLRFLHDYRAVDGDTATLDVTTIVSTLTHQITPESWVVGIGTTRAVAYTVQTFWDASPHTWDAEHPDNEWRN